EKDKRSKRLLNNCHTAKELMKYPVNVKYNNLGPNINSKYPDYYPYVTKDEELLAFTSRRPSNIGSRKEFDGYYPSDVWLVKKRNNGGWGVAQNAGRHVNTTYDEEVVGLSGKGKTMYVYIDHIKEVGDIYKSEMSNTGFTEVKKIRISK
ncbi:MAG: hypothetical protein ABEH43_10180, partial [Flavobacteriales bacterium]